VTRLLFIAQGVTLAHFARPLVLAEAMAGRGHEVVFAAPARYRKWAPDIAWRDLNALEPEVFEQRVQAGLPPYKRQEVRRGIEDDLALIGAEQPDVIIGDFRLSLAASARLAKVPYAALANAYWSPQRPLRSPPPAVPGAAWPWGAKALYRAVGPSLLRRFARPMAEVMAGHGVDLGYDLRRVFTDSDLTLHMDIPGLFAGIRETDRERFLGPVVWAPAAEAPVWWNVVPEACRVAYLTMGSSGDAGQFRLMEEVLGGEGYTVVSATAGRADVVGRFSSDFLPGELCCARAEMVVCNGGSPQVTQALLAGRPVIGVCSNLDQFLNMQAVQDAGAGVMLRSDALTAGKLRQAIRRVQAPGFAEAARRLQADGLSYDPIARFEAAVSGLAAGRGRR
jgi:UDP:flavonoid glycosyltransferase YjiC (YdhE family)